MVMMLVVVAGFVASLAITEMALFGNSTFGKQFQGAMDGCISDPGVFPAQAEIKVFRGQVSTGAQKFLEDELTLPGGLQPLGGEKITEFDFCFGRGHKQPG